ncbi:hypothetical protein CBW58_01140 [Yersinia frederiksenii]|nr:hypothetical protein CBW58_01140 [Yersinia frederiksenii]
MRCPDKFVVQGAPFRAWAYYKYFGGFMDLLRSLAGMCILLLIAYIFSVNKRKIRLRTVGQRYCCKSH